MKHVALFAAAALFGAAVAAAQTAPQFLETEALTLRTDAGDIVIQAEIADEPAEQQIGLMKRDPLADDGGMLFDFGTVRETAMWMKDTPSSLDMVFIDAEGRIVAIAERTIPFSERQVGPGMPVRAVLEIRGGRAAEIGLEPGDQVIHRIFNGGN